MLRHLRLRPHRRGPARHPGLRRAEARRARSAATRARATSWRPRGYAEAVHFAFQTRPRTRAFPSLRPDAKPLRLANPLSEQLRGAAALAGAEPGGDGPLQPAPRHAGGAAVRDRHASSSTRDARRDPGPARARWPGLRRPPGNPWQREVELDFFDLKGAVEGLADDCRRAPGRPPGGAAGPARRQRRRAAAGRPDRGLSSAGSRRRRAILSTSPSSRPDGPGGRRPEPRDQDPLALPGHRRRLHPHPRPGRRPGRRSTGPSPSRRRPDLVSWELKVATGARGCRRARSTRPSLPLQLAATARSPRRRSTSASRASTRSWSGVSAGRGRHRVRSSGWKSWRPGSAKPPRAWASCRKRTRPCRTASKSWRPSFLRSPFRPLPLTPRRPSRMRRGKLYGCVSGISKTRSPPPRPSAPKPPRRRRAGRSSARRCGGGWRGWWRGWRGWGRGEVSRDLATGAWRNELPQEAPEGVVTVDGRLKVEFFQKS